MKKVIFVLILFMVILSAFASASCEISISMLNQDPYPAVPGDYVKVVFQIAGSETTDCRSFYFDVKPEYPFSVESNDTRMVLLGGNYIRGYSSMVLKAYKLIVDKNALDGDQKLKVSYGYEGSDGATGKLTKEFDVKVEDSRTDFDVSVQEYNAATNTITFGIINIGKKNVESLTLEIPEQKNIYVKGTNKVIIGSLNSNDDTTANIEAIPKEGEIMVRLSYNDQINVRRTVEKEVTFSKRYLESIKNSSPGKSSYYYLFWGLIILIVAYFIYGYFKRRKSNDKKLQLLRNR
ncbi:MAG: hypothetical protein QXS38_01100 [Candidatus Pacearchaeota archaeon]